MKKCPYCAEEIQDEAIVCRYCGKDLQPMVPAQAVVPTKEKVHQKTRWLFLLLIPILLGAGYWGFFYSPQVGQYPKQTATALYLDGPCGVNKVNSSLKEIGTILDRWRDADNIAGQTPRMQLADQIQVLTAIKRDTDNLEVPECVESARYYLSAGMNRAIDGYLAFLADADANVDSYFSSAAAYFSQTSTAMATVRQCMPNCD